MWTISMLKENAKAALKNYYWLAVVVTLIVSLLGGGGGFSGRSSSASDWQKVMEDYKKVNEEPEWSEPRFDAYVEDENGNRIYDYDYNYNDYNHNAPGADAAERGSKAAALAAGIGIGAAEFAVAIVLALAVFIWAPIQVGQWKFYLDARDGNASVSNVFSQFGNGRYLSTVKTMFSTYARVFLWMLVPIAGWVLCIIRYYEYILVPYILAENPNISPERAREISKKAMDGEKFNYFGLVLSFFGWMFLGSITIIGNLFVLPYMNATTTEFYCCMREKAIASGIAGADEFESGYGFGGGYMGYPGQGGYQGYAPVPPQAPYQGGYQDMQNGYQGAQNGYQGMQNGYQGAQGGYQGTQGGYQGMQGVGYQGAQNGYQGTPQPQRPEPGWATGNGAGMDEIGFPPPAAGGQEGAGRVDLTKGSYSDGMDSIGGADMGSIDLSKPDSGFGKGGASDGMDEL